MTTITEIAEKLSTLKSALIFSHVRPDGDTLGCAFSLKTALESLGKKATVICPDKLPKKFDFIIDNKEVCQTVGDEKYDAHIAVDCPIEGMHDTNWNLFLKNKNTFSIDHHISNRRYAKYNYVEDCSSCCEIIYKLIVALHVQIDKQIANYLMLGICTDTGNFTHSSVTGETLSIASKLMFAGANLNEIYYQTFVRQTKNRAALFAETINKTQYFLDDKFAVLYIPIKTLEKYSCIMEDTEGFVDYPLSVDGVEVSVSILEFGDKNYKISFRSKGNINVNEIAAYFGGGGHVFASGCMMRGYIEDVIEKLVYITGTYL